MAYDCSDKKRAGHEQKNSSNIQREQKYDNRYERIDIQKIKPTRGEARVNRLLAANKSSSKNHNVEPSVIDDSGYMSMLFAMSCI